MKHFPLTLGGYAEPLRRPVRSLDFAVALEQKEPSIQQCLGGNDDAENLGPADGSAFL